MAEDKPVTKGHVAKRVLVVTGMILAFVALFAKSDRPTLNSVEAVMLVANALLCSSF